MEESSDDQHEHHSGDDEGDDVFGQRIHDGQPRLVQVPDVADHSRLARALFNGDRLTAVIDWECAGVGPAGVDLGALRLDAAMCFDVDAADDVLAGWETQAGRGADDAAYWDVIAALSTPPDVGWSAGTISAQGRLDFTRELLEQRRNRFLTDSLDEL